MPFLFKQQNKPFMKRILSTVLAIVFLVGASQAQSTDSLKHRKHGRSHALAELNLTAEQKEKLKTIRDAEKKELEALKADGKTDAGREARKTVHDKYRSQTEAILTPEQKAAVAEGKGDRGGKGDKFGKTDRNNRVAGMAEELNLTTDQKTKVTALNQSFKTKMEGIRNNASLSTEEKKTQSKAAAEEHRKSLEALLTPDQAVKLKSHGHKGPRKNRAAIL